MKALSATADMGIKTGAHFIFGLPGETEKEMLEEAEIISELPLTSVKFHQLQIIKGTAIEKEFMTNPVDFHLFTWEEYLEFIIKFLERLTPGIIIERFTGEVPPRFLAVTPWERLRNDQLSSIIEKKMAELDTWQGKYYNS